MRGLKLQKGEGGGREWRGSGEGCSKMNGFPLLDVPYVVLQCGKLNNPCSLSFSHLKM